MTDGQALGTIIRKVFGIPDPQREGEGRAAHMAACVGHSVTPTEPFVRLPGINQLISSDIDRVKTMSTPRLKRDGSQTHSLDWTCSSAKIPMMIYPSVHTMSTS